MMRPPPLFCLVLKGPTVDDETMCFEAWKFQALTHKDRTAKSAIFPFQARKVKKGHPAAAARKEHGVAPGRGPTIPPKSHAFSLKEELCKEGIVQKASLLFEAWRFLADANS
jgi:hypothetical protein